MGLSLARFLPERWRQTLKGRLKQLRVAYVARFRSYGAPELTAALRQLGIQRGDTVILHSAFSREYGFRGSAGDLIDVFLEAIGPTGHLLMVSLPYRNASLDWLESGRVFDVRKTPSMMGLVSEMFRRRPGVLRSLHPIHPVLAAGPDAARFVAAHPECLHSCGPGSPFDELARANGRAVFFNVPLDVFTFFHYLEHRVHKRLPFPLYSEKVFEAPVIDVDGHARVVRTVAFDRNAIRRRRPERLYEALRRRGSVASVHVGASELLAVHLKDAIDCADELERAGQLFYDMPPEHHAVTPSQA